MPISCRQSVAVFIALLFTLQTASAYHYPLPSETVRDAYFLGARNNFQTTDCLLQYVHSFTGPQTGRYFVSQVYIATPYQQIVLRGQRDTPGDSEVQMETDLQTHPLKFFVRVRVEWNTAYSGTGRETLAMPEFPHGSSVHVKQQSEITPVGVNYLSIYGRHVPMGEVIELTFDPAEITSAPLRISVRKPDGQVEEAEFNMAKLQ